MKTVIFIRHAKSDWGYPELSDFNRPLNARGKKDAPVMGKRMKKTAYNPDIVLLSSANRTRQTMELFSKAAKWKDVQHLAEDNLYHGPNDNYKRALEMLENNIDTVALCGHNPTITFMVNALSGSRIANIPTCGVAVIEFDIDSWMELSYDSGNLVHYDFPKKV